MIKKVITRFAPSPTGFLHIGGARTALFNWLYAKHYNGEFLLRIEDTDKKRSTIEAINAIINGMKWLGLSHDHHIVFQSHNQARHVEIAKQLINKGQAYYCYEETTPQKSTIGFRSKWRDNNGQLSIPKNIEPVVRLKVPSEAETIINDQVYGRMKIANSTLEDFIILRSDGTPTYMLSVVVDDHDMNITHIIRGSDHITNTAKQILIYQAMAWDLPVFAHIPLIHGADGNKLSKRHGALGIDEYYKMGFLAEAVRNYLVRLGWSHGDKEIISSEEVMNVFDLEHIGKSPANFDMQKLEYLNNFYLRNKENILEELHHFIGNIGKEKQDILLQALPFLTEKAKTLVELGQLSKIFIEDEIAINSEAAQAINQEILFALQAKLPAIEKWNQEKITAVINEIALTHKKKEVFQTLRALLTGTMNSPAILPVMLALGRDITFKRLNKK